MRWSTIAVRVDPVITAARAVRVGRTGNRGLRPAYCGSSASSTSMHRMGPGGMMERLKLTDEQKKKIEDIRYTHQKRGITQRAELESAQLDLGRLMRADTPDARAINAQIDRVSQLRAGLQKEHVAGMLETRGVLTPDQLKEWRSMRGGMGWGRG